LACALACTPCLLLAGPRDAAASTGVERTLTDLAREAAFVAAVSPLEATAAWEDGRIVTRTRARVDAVLAGSTPLVGARAESVVTIESRGGVVGTTGQLVEGEALLTPGSHVVVFLALGKDAGGLRVVGRAQGTFTLTEPAASADPARVVVHPAPAHLLTRQVKIPLMLPVGPTPRELDGRSLADLTRVVAASWEVSHAS
jgi:hypothetical protein